MPRVFSASRLLSTSGLFAMAAAVLATFAACAGGKLGALSTSNLYAVSALNTQFYKYGPAQAFGADSTLPKGEKVTLIKRAMGFSQISLANGETGYVATEDLTQLPPPTPTPKPKLASNNPGRRSAEPPLPERTLDLNDLPALPTNDAPSTPAPRPSFRVR